MKVRYFAWMKRTVGVADEEVAPPAYVKTVGELVTWLRARSAGHAEALAEGAAFGAAVDQRTATFDALAGRRARGRVLSALHRRLTPWPCASRKPTSAPGRRTRPPE